MDDIEDYHNNESAGKRKSVRLIIVGILLFAGLLSYFTLSNNTVSDYIGTTENPGIDLARH